MRSSTYQIKPRVRHIYERTLGWHYKVVWYDPGNYLQIKGKPLRYVRMYSGRGRTIAQALRACQHSYITYLNKRDAECKRIDALFAPPKPQPKSWWQRIFRV